jgi:phosphate transport system substrate-binding protein
MQPGNMKRLTTSRRNTVPPTIVCALLAMACASCTGRADNSINVSGSTSVSPFVEHVAERFQKAHPGSAINVQSLGSTAGIQAAIEGVAEIGMSSRELKPEEAAELDELVIARDALAVIVHPSNPVSNLDQEQVRRIFTGQAINWSEFGGPDRPIVLVVREAGSGTFAAFEELLMEGAPITPRALRQGSNGAIRQVVAGDPNAIGYISLGIVDSSVKAVDIGGVQATRQNVTNSLYKFVRDFLFVWPRGKPLGSLSQDFVNYVMSDEGQIELEQLGLIRVT